LRCRLLVKEELKSLGLNYVIVNIGEVEVLEVISIEQIRLLKARLHISGLELLDDSKRILIERIKMIVIEMIHYAQELPVENYSDYISEKMGYNYTYLSNIFAKVKGITIQQFILKHRIERAKELIIYDNLSLSDISNFLQYSSVIQLSNHFKKVTGLTPSGFKKLHNQRMDN
jgi:AraC-like DNA-binding protein